MELYYVAILAGLAAAVGLVFAIAAWAGLPIWVTLIGMVMVAGGCLVLVADMNRPNGGAPSFKTTVLMIVLFLPVMPVLLPAAVVWWLAATLTRAVRRR